MAGDLVVKTSTESRRILDRVARAIDALITIGDRYDGLFPSLIDRNTHRMLTAMPPAIPGQRDGDRAHLGSNLIHDEPLLMTMYALDHNGYTEAADRYLRTFSTQCTGTESGLFPWGEHAYWNLKDARPGNGFLIRDPSREAPLIHDHLRAVPWWLWEKLHTFNPECVERFSEGLDNHWVEIEPLEYIRHAHIDRKIRHPRTRTSCDFPRHSGFYIFDWAFAYMKTGRTNLLAQIERMLDYWWEKRLSDGLCLTESRTPADHIFHEVRGVAQTISLAASLLEAADLLDDTKPAIASEMRTRAMTYTDGFLAAPHDLEDGVFVAGFNPETGLLTPMAIWGSIYGRTPASYTALVCLCHHRISGDTRLLEWAQSAARGYLSEPFPKDTAVPAMDAGLGLGLLADLYAVTGEESWLTGGMDRAAELMPIYCGDTVLPSGAAGIGWYESQMGPSFLLHGLARIALLSKEGAVCPLEADYTGR